MRLTLIALALLASPALAQEMVESLGTVYDVTCNDSGAVLTPQDGSATVYLGRSCDAWSDDLGEGTWGWANGGVRADFEGAFLGFARQEVYCPDGGPQPDLIQCGL